MKYTLPLIALSFALALGCGKPTGKSAGKSLAPVAPAQTDTNRSAGEQVADSLQEISNTIRNVQALSENVINISKGLQLGPDQIAWEYKIIDPSDTEISLETRLNDLGKQGWELSASSPKGKFIFKRRQQQKE